MILQNTVCRFAPASDSLKSMFLLQCVPFFAFSFLDLSYVLLSFVSKRNGLFAYFSQFFLVFLCIFNNLEFREGQIFFVHSTKRLTHIKYFPAFFLYTMSKDIYTRLEESHHAISGMAQALAAFLLAGFPIAYRAFQALRFKTVSIELLVTIAAVGACIIGEFHYAQQEVPDF